jgi:Zn-dependent protease with chaperone function
MGQILRVTLATRPILEYPHEMDVLISVVLGIVVLIVVFAFALHWLGVGASLFDPVGIVVVWCSRAARATNRWHSRKTPLPSDVPPPPSPTY